MVTRGLPELNEATCFLFHIRFGEKMSLNTNIHQNVHLGNKILSGQAYVHVCKPSLADQECHVVVHRVLRQNAALEEWDDPRNQIGGQSQTKYRNVCHLVERREGAFSPHLHCILGEDREGRKQQ